MIKHILRFIFAISVVMITTVSGHARAANNTEKCIKSIATDIVNGLDDAQIDLETDVIQITSDGVIEFFTKNIDICREYLLSRTEDNDIYIDEGPLFMDLRWDYIIEEVAAALTVSGDSRQLFVCENHRSLQAGIDITLWAATIVSAIYSFGAGAVVIQGVKTTIKQGLKGLVKIGVKKAGKTAAKKTAAATAAKTAAQASRTATKKALANSVVSATKQSIKTAGGKGSRRVTNKALKKQIEKGITNGTIKTSEGRAAIKLLEDAIAKQSAATAAKKAAGTATLSLATNELKKAMTKFAISVPIASLTGFGAVYSFLESDLDIQVMNCTNTDRGEGCYLSCTKDPLASPTDDLNTKAFKPIFGKNLCVDETNNYVLREIESKGTPSAGKVFLTTASKWTEVKNKITSNILDKGNCDWNEDDIDMYIGVPLYDTSTLEPTDNGSVGLLIDGIRIDD